MIFLTVVTGLCALLVLKPFLTFGQFYASLPSESIQFTDEDVENWKDEFQHPFAFKYDPIQKAKLEENRSIIDEEEQKVLNLDLKEIY